MKGTAIIILLLGSIKIFSSCSNLFLNYGYNVSGNKVLYKNAFPGGTTEITEADAKTFKVLFMPGDGNYTSNTDFAVDKDHAFYGGGLIPNSDGRSFVILDRFFSKDKSQCYYRGQLITGADPATFKVKDETFSLDKNNVYKTTFAIDNNASVFESFDSSAVVRTANKVSVLDKLVDIAPTATFKFLRYSYFAIDGQVYFQGKAIQGVHENGFQALDDFFYKTPQHVYYGDKEIAGADAATYKFLNSPYGKDAHHVFFFEKTIEGADPASFEIINIKFQCARDKRHAYKEYVQIKNVSDSDMINKKECTSCNENALYFSEK